VAGTKELEPISKRLQQHSHPKISCTEFCGKLLVGTFPLIKVFLWGQEINQEYLSPSLNGMDPNNFISLNERQTVDVEIDLIGNNNKGLSDSLLN
jgi:hypothetical protein